MKLIAYSFVITAFFATACGGGGGASVSIVGDPPAQQAEEIADAFCDRSQQCGEASIDCTFNEETEMVECVGTIEDSDYDACVAETEPNILALLEACELTAAQEQTVQDCVNAVIAQPCISQSELDAYADEIEAGNEPEPLREYPESCEQADAIFESCGPQ